MKQSAAKSLGVAVVGAALAAAAAGTASATALPALGATDALGMVTGAAQSLPLQDATQSLTGQQQAAEGEQSTSASDPGQALGTVTGLLGGLPTSGLGG
ncbi:hypothetical protein [Streptomyces antimicrobicus]|uniref:ATP-binding protein n=1 Tax=Streptomyces antimicrobicus TaxID=2883108 RepID=A0ABS8B1P8_9ACTN|nr:hypothetical protein [Streptomyces antimicrobicus]MCB5178518.1 hypothetical protein [Streptomyces antimicrobicus]